jgi:hypothetical protein
MVPFWLGGMALWAIAGLVLLGFWSTLEAHGRGHWLAVCVAGLIVGVPGLALMMLHDARRRRRRSTVERPRNS